MSKTGEGVAFGSQPRDAELRPPLMPTGEVESKLSKEIEAKSANNCSTFVHEFRELDKIGCWRSEWGGGGGGRRMLN